MTGLNMQTSFCYSLNVFETSISLVRFVNDPHTLYNRLIESKLVRYRKTRKRVNQGKRNAELFLKFHWLFSRKQRLNQNSSIEDANRHSPFFFSPFFVRSLIHCSSAFRSSALAERLAQTTNLAKCLTSSTGSSFLSSKY